MGKLSKLQVHANHSIVSSVHEPLVHAQACVELACQRFVAFQVLKLLDYAPYKLVHRTKIMELTGKGKRGHRDAQAGTGEETFSIDEFIRLCTHLLQLIHVEAGRDLSICTMMFSCCGRSDDILLLFMPDLIKPRLIKSIGMPPHQQAMGSQ